MLLKNYLITALRNIRKHPIFSLGNIGGLAIGLSIFMLATLYAAFNTKFDTFHANADRIYGVVQVMRANNKGIRYSAIIPAPFLPAMKSEFPEIEDGVRFFRLSRTILKFEDKKFFEDHFLFVESNFLTFFNFKMIQGDPGTALSQPNSMVLTESSAVKYFGNENPVGKILNINNQVDVRITGIVENPPLNSSIRFGFLVSLETARSLNDWLDNWNIDSCASFVLLPKGYNPRELQAKFPAFLDKYVKKSPEAPERLFLFPLLDFHSQAASINLLSYLFWDLPYEILYFFLFLAVAVLLIVCVNFMNLSTAYHMVRIREVGLRKVVGATRFDLMKQFLGESVIMAFIALPIAVIFYQFIRPAFIAYIGSDIDITIWHYAGIIPVILAVTLIVGIFAGSYPAFFLSSFKPSQVVKGSLESGKKGSLPRKILVVSQFLFSIVLIVFTAATKNQLNYLYEMDFGYKRQGVIAVPISKSNRTNLEPMKEKFLMHPEIVSVSAVQYLPINNPGVEYKVIPEGSLESEKWTMQTFGVDYDFIELLDIKIIQGRSFSREYNDTDNFIINETAARYLNWEDPVGKYLTLQGKKGMIIGVAKDFKFDDIHFRVKPTLLHLDPENLNFMLIKVSATSPSLADPLLYIEKNWDTFTPDIPFEYQLLDHLFDEHYEYIADMVMIFGLIGGFAILISCLGLLGLTSYVVGRKTKEIGIRKALGASVNNIFSMLSMEFMRLIVLANIIAWPLAYFLLDGFMKWAWSYRIGVGIGVFILTGALTLVISIASISYHTVKAAHTNPVEALKYE